MCPRPQINTLNCPFSTLKNKQHFITPYPPPLLFLILVFMILETHLPPSSSQTSTHSHAHPGSIKKRTKKKAGCDLPPRQFFYLPFTFFLFVFLPVMTDGRPGRGEVPCRVEIQNLASHEKRRYFGKKLLTPTQSITGRYL